MGRGCRKLCQDAGAGTEFCRMASSRVRTWLAILAGGLIGGGVAVLASRSTGPPPAPVESVPSATPAPAPEPEAASSTATAPRDAAPRKPGFETRYAPPLPARPDAVKTAGLHCAWGHIQACLQTAAAYRTGQGVAAAPGEAKLYDHRARQLAIDLCEEGHAEACYALAYMYEHGVAFEARPDKVPALLARVRMLCRIRATPICRRVPPAADGG